MENLEKEITKVLGLIQNEKFNDAKSFCKKIIEEYPKNPDLLNLFGIIHFKMKNYEAAINSFKECIKINPKREGYYNNLGGVYKDKENYNEAIKNFNTAIDLNQNYFGAYNNKGLVLKKLGLISEAEEFFLKSIKIKPDFSEAYNNLGILLKEQKRIQEASYSFDNAIYYNSSYAEAYNNKGVLLKDLKIFKDAIECFDKAINIKKNYAEAYYNKALVYSNLNEFEISKACFEQAYKLNKDLDLLLGDKFFFGLKFGDWNNYSGDKNEILQNLKIKKNYSISPFIILNISDSSIVQFKNNKNYCETRFKKNNYNFTNIFKKNQKKIKVAYLSPDFRNHAVGYLVHDLIKHHDKSKFEIIGFYFGPKKKDDLNKKLSLIFDQFFNVTDYSDQKVADLIRSLKVHIAVDLTGHTRDQRMGIFERKCAPIQVNYLGYVGTIASDFYDYIVVDPFLVPKKNNKFFSEKLVYLPCFQSRKFESLATHNVTKADKGLPDNKIVFCCFNSSFKITPEIFDRWTQILKLVPNSILWLISDNEFFSNNLKKETKKRGLEVERIFFSKRTNYKDYLLMYKLADIFLDTFPFNAGATASNALWSGVPVITQSGDSFCSRMAGSLLTSLDLKELITFSEEEYVLKAIELGNSLQRLNEIKIKLKRNVSRVNFDKFLKHLEFSYEEMVRFKKLKISTKLIDATKESF